MTDYLPPVRPQFAPKPPPRKTRVHIAFFALAAVALIVAGWSWDRLHSLDAVFMTSGQIEVMRLLFGVSVIAFLVMFPAGLIVSARRNG